MRVVRFTKHVDQYNAGETAGFKDDVARKLIESGVAFDPAEKAAQKAAVDAAEVAAVEVKAPVEPPLNKMVDGSTTVTKGRASRGR